MVCALELGIGLGVRIILVITSWVWFNPVLMRLNWCFQVKPGTPVLMCSVPGYDASGLVRDLAAEQNKHITSISIGKTTQGVCGNSGLPKSRFKFSI